VTTLLAKRHTFSLVQLLDLLKEEWTLGDEGTLAQEGSLSLETMLGGESVHVCEELLFGDVDEGIANSAGVSKGRCSSQQLVLEAGKSYSPSTFSVSCAMLERRRCSWALGSRCSVCTSAATGLLKWKMEVSGCEDATEG
jgi:hypothetical protein